MASPLLLEITSTISEVSSTPTLTLPTLHELLPRSEVHNTSEGHWFRPFPPNSLSLCRTDSGQSRLLYSEVPGASLRPAASQQGVLGSRRMNLWPSGDRREGPRQESQGSRRPARFRGGILAHFHEKPATLYALVPARQQRLPATPPSGQVYPAGTVYSPWMSTVDI